MAKIVEREKDWEIAKMYKKHAKIGKPFTVFEIGIFMCTIVLLFTNFSNNTVGNNSQSVNGH